jgi:hypothetical protein
MHKPAGEERRQELCITILRDMALRAFGDVRKVPAASVDWGEALADEVRDKKKNGLQAKSGNMRPATIPALQSLPRR